MPTLSEIPTLKYCVMCLISGCLWALVACIMGIALMGGSNIFGGIMVSPLIGLAVGILYRPACGLALAARIFLSLATLYLAVTLFGAASGVFGAFVSGPPGFKWEEVVETILATLWGVTLTGWLVVLWPLSFVNHTLVCSWDAST